MDNLTEQELVRECGLDPTRARTWVRHDEKRARERGMEIINNLLDQEADEEWQEMLDAGMRKDGTWPDEEPLDPEVMMSTNAVDDALDAVEGPAPESYVYVIQGNPGGPVKVGWSKVPEERLQALQTAHHETLRLVGIMPGAKVDEKRMQRLLRPHHVRGEWFDSSAAARAILTDEGMKWKEKA